MTTVLIIPDTHCPAMRRGFVSFLQRIADRYSPDRIVHIGDLVDWASISYHEKHPGLSDARSEYRKALRQVARLYEAFPQADWLIGNHDSLTERQAKTAGILPELLRSYTDVWQVPNWTTHDRQAVLEIDGVLYSHGETGKGGQNAALKQAKDNFKSTVIGHFHSQAGVQFWANPDYRVFGLSVGCGVDAASLAMEYGRKFAAKPILGCGVVIDGKRAVFEPWLLRSK